jgi:hypothetical protein
MADHSPETADTPAGVIRGIIGTLAFAAGFEGVVMIMHGDFVIGAVGIISSIALSTVAYKWPSIHTSLAQRGVTLSTNVAAIVWVALVVVLILGLAYSPLFVRNPVAPAQVQLPTVPAATTPTPTPASALKAYYSEADKSRLSDALFSLRADLTDNAIKAVDKTVEFRSLLEDRIAYAKTDPVWIKERLAEIRELLSKHESNLEKIVSQNDAYKDELTLALGVTEGPNTLTRFREALIEVDLNIRGLRRGFWVMRQNYFNHLFERIGQFGTSHPIKSL